MNQITFKGYQNILQHQAIQRKHPSGDEFNIIAQVTDETYADLSQWKPVLERFPDSTEGNYVKVGCIVPEDKKLPIEFKLNNRKVIITTENIPVIKQITDLFNRVSRHASEGIKLPHDKNWMNSLLRLLNNNIKRLEELSMDEIQVMQDPSVIRQTITFMNESLRNRMIEYFA